MNEEQLREYIELQRKLIDALQNKFKGQGHTMDELRAIEDLQRFEDNLPCNQESE